MALVLLKRAFRPAAGRRMTPIIFGHIHRCQRNADAAHGTVIVVVLQSYEGNA